MGGNIASHPPLPNALPDPFPEVFLGAFPEVSRTRYLRDHPSRRATPATGRRRSAARPLRHELL